VILADYLLSNEYLVERYVRWRSVLEERGVDPEPVLANMHLREAYLMGMLETVDQHYGGIDGYLAHSGLREDELTAFRREFVVAD